MNADEYIEKQMKQDECIWRMINANELQIIGWMKINAD